MSQNMSHTSLSHCGCSRDIPNHASLCRFAGTVEKDRVWLGMMHDQTGTIYGRVMYGGGDV